MRRALGAIRDKKGLFGLVVLSLLVAVLVIGGSQIDFLSTVINDSSRGGLFEQHLDTMGADSLQSEGREGGAVSTSKNLPVTLRNGHSFEEKVERRVDVSPKRERELHSGGGSSSSGGTLPVLRVSSEVTRKFLEALPPYFDLTFQPPSVSLIFGSYIGGAYAKFRDEVMTRVQRGDEDDIKEREQRGLQSDIATHPHAAIFLEKGGEVRKKIDSHLARWSGGQGVGAEAKNPDTQVGSSGAQVLPPMLYPPMLPPFRYVGGLYFERTDNEGQTRGEEDNSIPSYALDTCVDLAKQDYREFATVVSRVNLYRYPLYNMPWHFHDPSPLCGRYMLRYLENTPQPTRNTASDIGALNPVPSEYIYGKYGETDRTPLPAAGSLAHYPPPLSPSLLDSADSATGSSSSIRRSRPAGDGSSSDGTAYFSQRHLHRLALFPPVTATNEADTASLPLPDSLFSVTQQGLASIKVIAGKAVFRRIGLETCGSERLDSDVFIVARLIGQDRVIAVDSVAASYVANESGSVASRMRNVLRYFNFLAPDAPGKYVFEAKYVHFNGSSTSNKEPQTLGVIGIRANDKGKSFKYNTICDMQRHVYGSPLEVEVMTEDSSQDKKEKSEGRSASKKEQNAAMVRMNMRSEGKGASSVDSLPPICTTANHTHGMWVRVQKEDCNTAAGSTFCRGDPTWLSDAAGFNTGLMWVPLVFSGGTAVESDVHTSLSRGATVKEEGSQVDDQSEVLKVIPRSSPPHLTSFIVSPNVFFVGSFNHSISKSAPLSSSIVERREAGSSSSVVATIPCRFHVNSPPGGPSASCLRIRENNKSPYTKGGTRFGASFTIVGDSVMREYGKNCALFNLRAGRIVCVFNNIVLEGQHYSKDYAKAVALNIIQAATRNKAAFFATNLGIHHMVGPCTTQQWVEFVDVFVELWKKAVGSERGSGKPRKDGHDLPEFHLADAHELEEGEVLDRSSPAHAEHHLGQQGGDNSAAVVHKNYFVMEKAIWIGPPSVHYARRGMSLQRAAIWDQLAWERLEPLGFQRLNAVAPTLSRQESTWDGLHYAAERGKVQTPLRDRRSQVRQWNGGVSAMLFTMLLNMICTV